MDCIFCKIINGEIPSYCIYEDEFVKAFLDINPISNGHTLVIPKNHFENIFEMDDEYLLAMEKACKKIGNNLLEKLHCDGVTRVQNNKYGQDVKHYHIHLIPRYINDNLEFKNDITDKMATDAVFELLK